MLIADRQCAMLDVRIVTSKMSCALVRERESWSCVVARSKILHFRLIVDLQNAK
jgi:hypothetical protein